MIFLNGVNLIRCSESEIQVYRLDEAQEQTIERSMQCSNYEDLIENLAKFLWTSFSIDCSTSQNHLFREKQRVIQVENKQNIRRLPDATVVNDENTEITESTTSHDNKKRKFTKSTIELSSIIPNSTLTIVTQHSTRLRHIYLLFVNYRVLCRLSYKLTLIDLCKDGQEEEIDDVDYFCYYTPLTDQDPTIAELESEFNQIQSMNVIDNLTIGESLVFNVSIPSASTWKWESDETFSPIEGQTIRISTERTTAAISNPKLTEKNSRKPIFFSLAAVLLFIIIVILTFILVRIYRKTRPTLLDNENKVAAINSIDSSIDQRDHSTIIRPDDNIAIVGSMTKNPTQRKIGGNSMMFNDEN